MAKTNNSDRSTPETWAPPPDASSNVGGAAMTCRSRLRTRLDHRPVNGHDPPRKTNPQPAASADTGSPLRPLSASKVRALVRAGRELNLHDHANRIALMQGIDHRIVSTIPLRPNPRDQLFIDLATLRHWPPAMQEWLENALLFEATSLAPRQVLEDVLLELQTATS